MIQRMHNEFTDGKNVNQNECIGKDKIILTKIEIRSGEEKQHTPQQGQTEDIVKANELHKYRTGNSSLEISSVEEDLE